MPIRVLVVDDSTFICNRIRDILQADPDFSVVAIAHNGLEALAMVAAHKPDVVTMDVEMPVMDGITAVKQIMDKHPCPILMLSAVTQAGAKSTFDALAAGAVDFLPKQLEQIDEHRQTAESLLRHRVRMVARQASRLAQQWATPNSAERVARESKRSIAVQADSPLIKPDLLVIAASTGGPVAIQEVLSQLPRECRFPVLLLQHMPKHFTKSFAERLNQLCPIEVHEAADAEVLRPGSALLAPGGMQTRIKVTSAGLQAVISEKQSGEIYSPCIDLSFSSIADVYRGKVLAIVMTGMGTDGQKGAARLKQIGAQIWAQDEASSTVYGMPRAVAEANLADKIYSLSEIVQALSRLN